MTVNDLGNSPKTKKRIQRLEHVPQQVHNVVSTRADGKLDQRIIALVRLLARRAAEEDFPDTHN